MIYGRHAMAKRGVTLIEVILVASIMGVIMAALVPYIRTVNQVWQYGHIKSEILQNGRVGLSHMAKSIRDARFISEIDTSGRFDEGHGDYIRIQDANSNPVLFFHNVIGSPYYTAGTGPGEGMIEDNDLIAQMIVSGAMQNRPLASSVDSLTFTYLDWRMDPLFPATSTGEVKGVLMNIVLSDRTQELQDTHTLNSVVALRMARNSAPGIWVTGDGFVKKLNANGDELFQIQGAYVLPLSPSIDPNDGSAWITDGDADILVKLGADGSEVFRKTGLAYPTNSAINPDNGFCWVLLKDSWEVAYYRIDGTQTLNVPLNISGLSDMVVETGTGNLWIADSSNTAPALIQISNIDGSERFRVTNNIGRIYKLAVDPADNTCWVLEKENGNVIKFENDGQRATTTVSGITQDIEITGLNSPTDITVDPSDSSLWIGNRNELLRYSADGQTLIQQVTGQGIDWPCRLSVDQQDGANGAIWFVNGIPQDATIFSGACSVIKIDIGTGQKDLDLDHTGAGRYLWVAVDPRER